MIGRLRAINHLIAFLLSVVTISCSRNSYFVETIQPAIDTAAMVKYGGNFSNGPYGSVSGNVAILKQRDSLVLSLSNFNSSSGPALHVYLSKEVQPVNFIDLGSLRSNNGDQAYSIAGMPDFSQYKYALIHCKQYNHLFGSALIQ